jgi:putative restriction endonuclease
MHKTNPEIVKLSALIDRSPGAVVMRLSNFASIDPFHQERGVVGLPGDRKQCQLIWDEFNTNRENLIFESERIIAEKENSDIETKYGNLLKDVSHFQGEDKIREVKARVNQRVFRQIVLGNYSQRELRSRMLKLFMTDIFPVLQALPSRYQNDTNQKKSF